MLPLPNLDDRMFKQIVEDAKKMIPKLAPQWTDENYHDPGITLIELFAWLTEMQQYYLDRITVKNELKFLKLLGIHLKEAVSAKADVTFSGAAKEIMLPRGTKLLAGNQFFETEEPLHLVPAKIEKIIVFSGSDSNEFTSTNNFKGVGYYAFGRKANKGNRLYIGFDRELPINKAICLTINLYEEYSAAKGGFDASKANFHPSARVSWKYYGAYETRGDSSQGWIPLHILKDQTAHMTISGRLTFKISTPMNPGRIHPANDRGRYWICCTVEEEGYEISPQVDNILLNTISSSQRNTLSEVVLFSSSGQPGQVFEVDHYLSFYGSSKVQVQDQEGNWHYWNETTDFSVLGADDTFYMIKKNMEEKKVFLIFGSGECGKVPCKGKDNIRLITYLPSFEANRYLGRSNGLPHQLFHLQEMPVMGAGFMLQVGRKLSESQEYIWQDWKRVNDFDSSKPGDRHYVLNTETGEILFGNNENGIIPEIAEEDNICILSCQVGGGEAGNLKENEINNIVMRTEELQSLRVMNYSPAVGGAEIETIEDAKRRVKKDLKKQYRAVTCEDFEEITRATPGLRVARVKAIPLYTKEIQDYPTKKAPAQVTVVVVPYSQAEKPIPSKGFLKTVQAQLNRYRLITTEVHVIPAEYIKITVHAVVVAAPYVKTDSQKIVEGLKHFLKPLHSQNGSKGWPFGRTVYKGDIYGVINKIEGVEYIKDLWLNAEGVGFQKELSGDIQIPPYGLVYSGEHQIEIVSRRDL